MSESIICSWCGSDVTDDKDYQTCVLPKLVVTIACLPCEETFVRYESRLAESWKIIDAKMHAE